MSNPNELIIVTLWSKDGWNKRHVEKWKHIETGYDDLTYYTNPLTKELTAEFHPQPVVIGYAFEKELEGGKIECVVHPILAFSGIAKEFCGVDLGNHQKLVEWSNWHLDRLHTRYPNETRDIPIQDGDETTLSISKSKFVTNSDTKGFDLALERGYLELTKSPDGTQIYIPTRKAVDAICDTRAAFFDYMMAHHTGVIMGGSKRRPLGYGSD